jgi:ATP-binding cassette, subfamily F, member 3
MPLLTVRNLTKYYGSELILEDLEFAIDERDRVGLIGANGTGKTTLCRLLLGTLKAESGDIHFSRGATVGYLAQDQPFEEGATLWQAVIQVFAQFHEMEAQLAQLEHGMSDGDQSEEELEAILGRYSRLREAYEHAGGYEYEQRTAAVLTGVGFAPADYHREVSDFSGGEKQRAGLARILLQRPDLLLLDEPTNHLDIQGTEWLEGYLRDYDGAVIVISHDRRFLDNVVGRILELEACEIDEYTGNYSTYLDEKQRRTLHLTRAYEKQQRDLKKQMAFIRWALGTQQEKLVRRAKSRLKLLDKIDEIDPPPSARRKMHMRFKPKMRGGDEILELRQLGKSYGERVLFEGISLFVRRGQKVAIVGPNGCGKTTLLKVALGLEPHDEGSVRLGRSVEVGYYSQEQNLSQSGNTVMQEFREVVPDATPAEVRNLLAKFLFVGDDVFKRVGDLSGGEQSRLALAKLIMQQPTFLVLDEPTNHLDIDSRGALEGALRDYQGTLLVVSHDRYFLDRVVSRIVVMRDGVATSHEGNYTAYLEALRRQEEQARLREEQAREEEKRVRLAQERLRAGQRRPTTRPDAGPTAADLEDQAGRLEVQLEKVQTRLADPVASANEPLVRALNAEYVRLSEQLHDTYEQWEATARAESAEV